MKFICENILNKIQFPSSCPLIRQYRRIIFLGTVSAAGAGIECWSDGVRVVDTTFTWEHSGLPIDSALWLPDEPNPNHPKYSVTIQKSSGQYGLKNRRKENTDVFCAICEMN